MGAGEVDRMGVPIERTFSHANTCLPVLGWSNKPGIRIVMMARSIVLIQVYQCLTGFVQGGI